MYEYQCSNPKCNHKSETLRDLKERDAPLKCSRCNGRAIRVVSLGGRARFVGGGWTPTHFPK